MPRAPETAGGTALPVLLPAPLPETLVQTSAQTIAGPAVPAKPKPEPIHPPDDFTGIGGRYSRDPNTGVRTRIADPAADEAAEPATQE